MLVQTTKNVYDKNGKFLGMQVIEVEGYTQDQLSQCPECNGLGGSHRDIFIVTEQDGFGEVRGHYTPCSQKAKLVMSTNPEIISQRIRSIELEKQ